MIDFNKKKPNKLSVQMITLRMNIRLNAIFSLDGTRTNTNVHEFD